jgi:ubiquinone/menaquinone biosynthesis C-methylase UbiE
MSVDNGYVTAEYLKKAAQRVRALKELSYKHMAIATGATVLDAGCGPGVDTVPLAERVGEHGRVIGIDSDEAMLTEAKTAAGASPWDKNIEHRCGSVLELPLGGDSVDASRAERLLQVLPPEAEPMVMGELIRVTRPGGRIVLVDADWSSASVDFSGARLERRLMEFFTLRMRPNGLAGRRLYSLCRDGLLEEIRVDVVPVVQYRLDDTPFGQWLITTATSHGVMSTAEARLWEDELQRREQQQRFLACVNMVVVSGRKPEDWPGMEQSGS